MHSSYIVQHSSRVWIIQLKSLELYELCEYGSCEVHFVLLLFEMAIKKMGAFIVKDQRDVDIHTQKAAHGMCANLYDVSINFYGWFSFVAHFHAHFALSIYLY